MWMVRLSTMKTSPHANVATANKCETKLAKTAPVPFSSNTTTSPVILLKNKLYFRTRLDLKYIFLETKTSSK